MPVVAKGGSGAHVHVQLLVEYVQFMKSVSALNGTRLAAYDACTAVSKMSDG